MNSLISEYLRILDECLLNVPLATSSTDLHHLTYPKIKKNTYLPSNIVEDARNEAWRFRKVIERKGYAGKFKINKCSIHLIKRYFKYFNTKRGTPCFKITYSQRKSFIVPVKTDRQFQRFNSFLSDNWYFDNIYLLKDGRISVVLEKEFVKTETNQRYVIGIDIGSSTLASATIFDIKTSKIVKQLYFGKDIAIKQREYLERRAKLKSLADKGSHKAKKSLEKLKHKQFNFVKTRSGQIAKEIVNLAKSHNAYISIEKISLDRRGKFNKKANGKINRIPYGKFKQFLKSNCEMFHIPLHEVDAYHTSKWCSKCGALNKGHQSGNYSLYKCECGLIVNSDRKASLVVAVKSVLERNKTHSLINLSSIQISKMQVPVNGLLRSDDVDMKVAVQNNYQPMENLLK